MALANAALAEGSDSAGVILVGMAGIGKTACALELADLQWASGSFSGFVWHKAPDAGRDIGGALNDFASAWERQLVELSPPALSLNDASFEPMLDRLSSFLAARSVLIVLDNLESLLDGDGTWRDKRFEKLVAALFSQPGGSRTILTSRIRPALPEASVTGRRVRAREFSVNALTLDEALLLARQMPNLNRLLGQEQYRGLVRQVLEVAQGHPKLLELAEKQADSPEALAAHVRSAYDVLQAGSSRLNTFFASGETVLSERQFIAALADWTQTVVSSLREAERRLFEFLCCLEEVDRCSPVVGAVWTSARKRLRVENSEAELAVLSERLEQVGLLERRTTQPSPGRNDVPTRDVLYYIHPAIAETGAAKVQPHIRSAVDKTLADWWEQRYRDALEGDAAASADVVEAGLRAAPYLLRLRPWDDAADMLEEVRYRDESPAVNERLLPHLRRILVGTKDANRYPRNLRILGSVLLNAGEFEDAERSLKEAARKCRAARNYKEASVALELLLNLLRRTGRSKEGFRILKRTKMCTKRAGLGPWSQLADEISELSLLHDIGEDTRVLTRFRELDKRAQQTTETLGSELDPAEPWGVREWLFDVARQAALSLGQWDLAIELNERAIQSQEERGAPPLEIAQLRFNDCVPRVKLGHFAEARDLIVKSRAAFEAEKADRSIGETFAALAALEHALGRTDLAVDHEATALRYRYKHRDPEACARGHFQLAEYLAEAGYEGRVVGAHRCAGALIRYRTWAGDVTTLATALELQSNASRTAPLPPTLDVMCTLVEKAAEGVSFRDLVMALPVSKAERLEEGFRKVIELFSGGDQGRSAARGV
jgi:tetratricopeptide (TPR) repeat protein